ncbi:uncharacterized protein C8Q71DRAFT_789788 [Rhodofomes roseus]|uniref:Uncharacterized protein n=1 Tax=Rhodofomes roseus TaxID=34475 RepID=A0ABQ8JZ80_9APHY|nr:uncharacterized protein C8Q71DRAFT_789788 [Rhodofomes roseus]KAH9829541.1 hypothetical protein C8Q71DRAFT_789788 [Rhodofomes roseus]
MPAEKQLQTLTVSYEKDLANIRQFLVISPGETLKEPSLQHCQMLRGKQNWEALITKLRSVHLDRTMKYCVEDSIIWCPSSSMRCLFVHPVHCYQPETHTFRPFDYNGFIKPGETRELCLSKGDTSFYCGTFRCAEASHLRTEDLIQLGVANQDRLFGYLVTRVMTLGSSVPPAGGASRSRLLRNAYLDGTILVRCHSMEYIGRNSTVSTFFVRCAGDGSAPGQPVANLTHNAGERHKRAKIEIP